MNAKMKRRMAAVTGVIIIVLVAVLAVVGGGNAAKAVTVADIAAGGLSGQKVQVSGNVVENSFATEGEVLTFAIRDAEGDPDVQVRVRYEGGVSATFGNDVTAICTGRMDDDGVLHASELVTKCPSKYENATEALSVARLLEYGDAVLDKPVKVTGAVAAGTLSPAGSDVRFSLADAGGGAEVAVRFDGALPDEVEEGANLVVTGSLGAEGSFAATEVSVAR